MSGLSPVERFWAKVEKQPDGCWIWRGRLTQNGYGRFWAGIKEGIASHRFAYELLIGPIPEGLELDHLCGHRDCCNPNHLEPVNHRENVLRGTSMVAANAVKTHCKRGHEFTRENTYISPKGGRECRICRDERRREHVLRKTGRLPEPRNRDVCRHGHPFTPENTLICHGHRYCRACNRDKARHLHRTKAGIPLDAPKLTLDVASGYCQKGHPLTEETIYVRPNGVRQCRICKRERLQEYRRKRRPS